MNQTSEKSTKSYETILVSVEFGNIFLISLNRPDKLNAFNSLVSLALFRTDRNSYIKVIFIDVC
jgi:hypothetical protein